MVHNIGVGSVVTQARLMPYVICATTTNKAEDVQPECIVRQ